MDRLREIKQLDKMTVSWCMPVWNLLEHCSLRAFPNPILDVWREVANSSYWIFHAPSPVPHLPLGPLNCSPLKMRCSFTAGNKNGERIFILRVMTTMKTQCFLIDSLLEKTDSQETEEEEAVDLMKRYSMPSSKRYLRSRLSIIYCFHTLLQEAQAEALERKIFSTRVDFNGDDV